MNEIVKVYKNSPVRIVEKGGEPWFVAKDVCDILALGNPRSSIALLDEDERGERFVVAFLYGRHYESCVSAVRNGCGGGAHCSRAGGSDLLPSFVP